MSTCDVAFEMYHSYIAMYVATYIHTYIHETYNNQETKINILFIAAYSKTYPTSYGAGKRLLGTKLVWQN